METLETKPIEVMDFLPEIMKGVKKGVLITTQSGQRVNMMTISWGKIGIEWNKLIFTAYIRESRYTHEMLEENAAFTINIPMAESAAKILGFCGSKSGRDFDKVKELGLTLSKGQNVDVPGIKELPLTLECKVVYKQVQDPTAIPAEHVEKFYPQNMPTSDGGIKRDIHTMFYGEIVGAYVIE